jgi:hypothetical protein
MCEQFVNFDMLIKRFKNNPEQLLSEHKTLLDILDNSVPNDLKIALTDYFGSKVMVLEMFKKYIRKGI